MSLKRYIKDPDMVSLIQRRQRSSPVDLAGIAEDLGVNLWEENLAADIWGKIFRDQENGGRSGFSIVVAKSDPFVRKRFTAAHEIAHFLLHRNQIGNGVVDKVLYRSNLSDTTERDANQLAAEILMPVSLLQEMLGEGISKSAEIARALQVSEAALKIRMGSPT